MCKKCDLIVDEVRKSREEHAKKFNYNLRAIYEDLIEQERLSGRRFVSYDSGSENRGELKTHNLPGDDEVLYGVNSKYFVKSIRNTSNKVRQISG